MSTRGSVLMLCKLSLILEVQSGIPRFCTSARAGKCTLERRIRASSISLHCFTVRSSGGLGARAESCLKLERRRAEISPIQYFYSTLERESWRSSVYLCCMSARAGKPTLERDSIFLKLLKLLLRTSLHPHPILGILRPSLRRLVEDIDIENTEALGVKLLSFPIVWLSVFNLLTV